ncbi:MAG: hypothetical protein JNL04_17700 [Rhodospirillaceae bacterium]|nr:hypothetical protein [Rhodospirillaceae bacterium]
MRLDEYVVLVAGSQPADWRVHKSPTFHYRVVPVRGGPNRIVDFELHEHNVVLTFSKDVGINMCFGLVQDRNYSSAWSQRFPDKRAQSSFLDFFYNGALVFRETLVWVDGWRCVLPEPTQSQGPPFPIPARKYQITKLVHGMVGPGTNFDDYFRRAGMAPSQEAWP